MDVPATVFFDRLAVVSGSNVMVQPDVSTRLTLTLRQVTLAETLHAVRELYGLDFQTVGTSYMVLAAKPQTRVFQLNYLDLHRSGVSNTRVSSGQITQGNSAPSSAGASGTTGASEGNDEVSGTSVLTTNDSDFWKGIETDIKLLVGGEAAHVVVNRQSGVIVVRGMPSQLRDVATYLQKTQSTVTRQVILEAKIVEVELNSGFQAGINWSTLLTHGSQNFFFGQSTPPGGFGADPFTPTGSQVSVTPGVPVLGQVVDQLGGAFTMAIDAADFNGFIELLSSQGNTRVLSSPRVSTLHNQKAIIKAGSDEFFVTGVKSDTTTGTSTNTSLNVELTPFFSGVALDVTPQIGEDGTVLLHIHPTVSEVSDQSKRVNFGGGSSDLPLALSQIRESDSVVRARSGQLIVIGGLMRETRRRADYRTPLLGDVPLLGRLFRSERDQTRTVELVLLLRPLVPTDADWEKLAQEPQDRAAAMAELGKVEKPK
ncbi:MAG: pilus (MSHA type) biogenesis protein MshL [Proteobacteria bacterium]|nr:pilus (MSHA type) biogenesis protein MshL [Pseudomonadota bacterium]